VIGGVLRDHLKKINHLSIQNRIEMRSLILGNEISIQKGSVLSKSGKSCDLVWDHDNIVSAAQLENENNLLLFVLIYFMKILNVKEMIDCGVQGSAMINCCCCYFVECKCDRVQQKEFIGLHRKVNALSKLELVAKVNSTRDSSHILFP
jgi:hypothetical protein